MKKHRWRGRSKESVAEPVEPQNEAPDFLLSDAGSQVKRVVGENLQ